MKVVVDTNIIFSALLNSSKSIGDLLFNSDSTFQFYSCNHMRVEISKHWPKLKRISKLSEEELQEAKLRVFEKVHFVNEELIPEKTWLIAEEIAMNIDINDVDFIAMTKHLKGYLWTGDKELYEGLKKRKFKSVVNTAELIEMRLAKN